MAGMMELYTEDEAANALDEALETKAQIIDMLEKLNNYIFFLKYFLNTGEALNPDVIDLPEDDND